MILTCPQCEANYMLPAQALVPEGRKVRCTECGEVWKQIPDTENLEGENIIEKDSESIDDQDLSEKDANDLEKVLDDFDDIPDAVKPLEDDFTKSTKNNERQKLHITKKSLVSIGLVFCVFLILLGLLLNSRKSLEALVPGVSGFYKALGYEEKELPGEALIFDKLKTSIVHKTRKSPALLKLEGSLINMTSKVQRVPVIEVAIRDENGDILDRWMITDFKPELAKEETMHFSAQYKDLPENAVDVNLRLLAR